MTQSEGDNSHNKQILERINTTIESVSGEVLHNINIKNLTFTIWRRNKKLLDIGLCGRK